MTPVEKKEFFVSDIQPICEADSRDEISVNLSAIDRISRKEKISDSDSDGSVNAQPKVVFKNNQEAQLFQFLQKNKKDVEQKMSNTKPTNVNQEKSVSVKDIIVKDKGKDLVSGKDFEKIKKKKLQEDKPAIDAQLIQSLRYGKSCGCEELVLVVEDNNYNVVPIRMLIKQFFGLKIKRAENGMQGFEMLKADLTKTCCDVHFQLILMDINMPVMGGIQSSKHIQDFQDEFYENLSAEKIQLIPRAPVLAMTAFCNQKTINECKMAGMIGILYKPISKCGLQKQIQCVVKKEIFGIMQDKLCAISESQEGKEEKNSSEDSSEENSD